MNEHWKFYFTDRFGKNKWEYFKPDGWDENIFKHTASFEEEPLIDIPGLIVSLSVRKSKQAYYFTRNNIGTSFKIEPGTPINTEVFEDLEPYIHKSDLLCLENVLYCAEGDQPCGYRYDPMYEDEDEEDDIYFDEDYKW